MYTVITKGNKVKQIDEAAFGGINDIMIINESGKVLVNKGNPITWPTDATDGLQAIVDVKAGTLRFGWGPVSGGREFVVAEYVVPFVPFVSVEDCDLSVPVQPKSPVTKEEVMILVDVWPHDDNIPVNRDIASNWIWSRKSNKNVIINLVDNVNSGVVITENDWRNYLSEELRKYPPVIGTEHDPVNRPSHYTTGGIECIDAIKASMSTEAFLGFLKGNVQKYMWRYEKKVAPVEDLKKAQWYLSKLIEEQEQS